MATHVNKNQKLITQGKTFRIWRFDERNLMLEKLEHNKNPKTGEFVDAWHFHGFYGQMKHLVAALLFLEIKIPEGTLENQVKDLIAELKATEERLSKQISEK